jgi:hypothetical protein
MKKKQSLLFLVFTILLASCSCLKKHQKSILTNKKLSEQLAAVNSDKSDLRLFSDSLLLKNNRADIQTSIYEQSSAAFQYQVDSLLLDLEAREKTTESLNKRVAMLNKKANTVRYKNIIVREVNTVQQIVHEIHNGKIAFYCPSKMYYNQTYDAYGLIADVLSDEVIKKMVVKKIKEHAPNTPQETLNNKVFLIRAVQYYEILELKLDSAVNKGFDIVKVHLEDQQIITNKMETWHWKVTPRSTAASQQLILKIIVQDINGERSLNFNKTYMLEVKIKPSNFFHNTKVLFIQNPKWTFATVLLPLLTFFGGRYQRRKKDKRN